MSKIEAANIGLNGNVAMSKRVLNCDSEMNENSHECARCFAIEFLRLQLDVDVDFV